MVGNKIVAKRLGQSCLGMETRAVRTCHFFQSSSLKVINDAADVHIISSAEMQSSQNGVNAFFSGNGLKMPDDIDNTAMGAPQENE